MPRKSKNWLSVEGMTDEEIKYETEAIEAAIENSSRAIDEGCIEVLDESQ